MTVIFTITFVGFASFVAAADYEIAEIKPVFNKATPLFGNFKGVVGDVDSYNA